MTQITSKTGAQRRIETAQRLKSDSLRTQQEEDPRLGEVQKQLGLMLAQYRARHPDINTDTFAAMEKLMKDFRTAVMHKGIKMPELRLVCFLKMNHVAVWPAQLESAELQKRLHTFIVHRRRHNLPVYADDMAQGVRRAYPDYSPSRHVILPPEFNLNTQETVQ